MAERLGDWLATKPFALAMSSGFFSFYAHTGMLLALLRAGTPRLVSGSSAGALVGAGLAAGVPPGGMRERLLAMRRDEFWDPTPGAGVLAGRKFDRLLRDLLPVAAFEDCSLPMRISVFDIAARRTVVMARGDLSAAVRASCAVPVLFHPVWIERRAYWDGGILDRPGLAGVPEGERVLFHHISSLSPWRWKLPIPRRPGMVTLVIDGLPRVGPFRLEAGHRALDLARAATERALDAPIVDGVVRVAA